MGQQTFFWSSESPLPKRWLLGRSMPLLGAPGPDGRLLHASPGVDGPYPCGRERPRAGPRSWCSPCMACGRIAHMLRGVCGRPTRIRVRSARVGVSTCLHVRRPLVKRQTLSPPNPPLGGSLLRVPEECEGLTPRRSAVAFYYFHDVCQNESDGKTSWKRKAAQNGPLHQGQHRSRCCPGHTGR